MSRTSEHAEVELDGRRADAVVRVERDELPESALDAALARAWLALAEDALDDEPSTAAAAARRGLDALADTYRDPAATVEDDTEMKVLSADKVDDPGQQAALLVRALEARLELYSSRYHELGLAFEVAGP